MKLGTEVGFGSGHIVLDGEPAPPKKGTQPPNFRRMPVVGKRLDGSRCHLYGPRPRQYCVRWGPSFPQRDTASQFLAHVYCGETAGWIKTPLGTEVDLGPGHIVLNGDSAPPSPERGTTPSFRPKSIVAKRSPTSATAEHLLDKQKVQLVISMRQERYQAIGPTNIFAIHDQWKRKQTFNLASAGKWPLMQCSKN